MSSTQDVRYSAAKVEQGRDLANKLWNASRLILLGAAEAEPRARPERVEDRWILSRLQRATETVSENLDAYDFAHAALEIYRFVWSELCDWYLEIAKPRLYDGEEAASQNLLWLLERVLALAHPLMPFVTEEIWSYLPARRTQLVAAPFPETDPSLLDPEAEAEIGGAIELTQALRRWRDLAGVEAAAVLRGRAGGDPPHEAVGRLARFEFREDGGAPVASVGSIDVLPSEELDAAKLEERLEERRGKLRSEVERAEQKLANERFVGKAPADVVDAEREKLDRYRAELADLGE